MPPRKRTKGATEEKAEEPTRRSTRSSKRSAPIHIDSSSDELSSKDLTIRGHDATLSDTKGPSEEEVGDVITVRVTRSKSHASSRPSTAKSDSTSQSHKLRIVSAPSEGGDVDILDIDNDGKGDEFTREGPAMKKSKPSTNGKPSNSKRFRYKYDNPDEMLTNPLSPLATAQLRELLCSKVAWDLLSTEEKQQVLAKFPDEKEILDAGTENARPNISALRNNNNFRHDIVRYQGDLKKGWHDPEWIRQAQAAHSKREIGFYNEYISDRFQEDWNMEMPGEEDKEDGHHIEERPDVKVSEKDGNAQEEVKERDDETQKSVEDPDLDPMKGVTDTPQANGEEHLDKKASEQVKVLKDEIDYVKKGGESQEHPSDITMKTM
ncbi:putative proline-rich early nodulin protein [Daldinia childiae]|uniref:putative proline-rich early nodulin protein n=1 Tax=Daldinia childiae TaxID=326645 RepID=UPI001444A7D4|nr:putative proline-rich early nodulin protein [Daldinia childiae]KAF3069013.1 putative proline-rich early nodulin protein [Daldinia childiae]